MPKPEYILCPFCVIIDSREQSGFYMQGFTADAPHAGVPLVIPVKTAGLKTGDYSIEGYEDRCTVERKNLSDLYSTLIHDRDRFERELERMQEMEFSAVVIEAGWSSILHRPPANTQIKPKAIYRSILAYSVRYKTKWFAMDTRQLAEHTVFRLLERFYKEDMRKLAEAT